MATGENQAAGNTAVGRGGEKEVLVTGREAGQVPEPKHGDPTESQRPGVGETVLGVRTGSEAAVESGIDPVLPVIGGLAGATEVKNKDLKERDEKEFKKRGLGRNITFSYEGPMMVDFLDDERPAFPQAGGTTVNMGEKGVLIRPMTEEEVEQYYPSGAEAARRANDLVAGSGVGGGGNPMHAGDARGVSSRTDRQVGQGGVTSKTGQAPGAAAAGQTQNPIPNAVSPQGGGTTSRR